METEFFWTLNTGEKIYIITSGIPVLNDMGENEVEGLHLVFDPEILDAETMAQVDKERGLIEAYAASLIVDLYEEESRQLPDDDEY